MPWRDLTPDRIAMHPTASRAEDLPDYGLPRPGVLHLLAWAICYRRGPKS
jgi:hypothetical protein